MKNGFNVANMRCGSIRESWGDIHKFLCGFLCKQTLIPCCYFWLIWTLFTSFFPLRTCTLHWIFDLSQYFSISVFHRFYSIFAFFGLPEEDVTNRKFNLLRFCISLNKSALNPQCCVCLKSLNGASMFASKKVWLVREHHHQPRLCSKMAKNEHIPFRKKKKFSPTGNWTPVSRVTGGDTHHYTIEDDMIGNRKMGIWFILKKRRVRSLKISTFLSKVL